MAEGEVDEARRPVHAEDVGAAAGELAREPALAAAEIEDADPGQLAAMIEERRAVQLAAIDVEVLHEVVPLVGGLVPQGVRPVRAEGWIIGDRGG